MTTKELIFNKKINAPVSQVFLAFTNATAIKEWMCDIATIDPKPGGRFYAAWNDGFYTCGEYTHIQANQSVGLTWYGKGEPASTSVRINLHENNGFTEFELMHEGIGTDSSWETTREYISYGWKSGLENLTSILETGEDLRITRRPMIGIGVTDFNEEIARKLGVPVFEGVRIDSTLEGMGAQAAGLQQNDVLIKLGEISLIGYNSVGAALHGKKAGDEIDIEYYRGSDKRTSILKLSGREIPKIPASTKILAQEIAKNYAKLNSELAEIFNGVSDSAASKRPAEGEWNAKEIVAHLIHGERYTLSWIADLFGGQVRWTDGDGGNLFEQVQATVATYPTVKELLDELRRTREEIAALIHALPESFQQRKSSCWRLAFNLLEQPFHDHTHFEQIRQSIAS